MDPDKTYQLGKVAVELHQTIKDVVDYLTAEGNAIPKKAPQALANHPITEEMYVACVKKFNHDLFLRIEKEKEKSREDLKRREQEQKRREEMARIEQEIKRTTHLDTPLEETEPEKQIETPAPIETVSVPEPIVETAPIAEPVIEPEVAPKPVTIPEPEPQHPVEAAPEPQPPVQMQPEPEPKPQPVPVVTETVVTEPVIEQPITVSAEPVATVASAPVEPSAPPAKPATPEGSHIPLPKHSGLKIVSTGEPAPPRVRRKPETPPHSLTKVPRGKANLPREAAPPRPSPVPTTSAKHAGAPGARPTPPTSTTETAKTETTADGEKKWRRLSKLTKAEADELVRAKSKALKERVAPAALPEIARSRRPKSRKSVDSQAVESQLRQTLAAMSEGRRSKKRHKRVVRADGSEVLANVLRLTEFVTTAELANLLEVEVGDLIKKCIGLGILMTMNQRLDKDTIVLLCSEFGTEVEFITDEDEEEEEVEADAGELKPRQPVVTVMGHVDHGKTTLLDYLRKTNVAAGEHGGITQHIGAYEVQIRDQKITFLDTPGHEAFTAMRARGAQITDIVVLVVAADDQVMPQTLEAIDHAKAAGVPIVIAINKIDKPNAQPDVIKRQLADRGVLIEEWGGKYQCAEIAAKKGLNIEKLLDEILIAAEIAEIKAGFEGPARGVVLESRLDKGRGAMATILVQRGTLRIGDAFVAGQQFGKIRMLLNERGERRDEAFPGQPVQIVGFNTGIPQAGDRVLVYDSERDAKDIANRRAQQQREQQHRQVRLMTLEQFSRQQAEGSGFGELNVVIKGDADGSVEVLADSLMKLSGTEVKVNVIRKSVGAITESDVLLAAASHAIVIGFHVHPNVNAREVAEREKVDIRTYRIIYQVVDDVKKALEGLLRPDYKEVVRGTVTVREVFKISRLGTIAGCYVTNGVITRSMKVRLLRDGKEIWTGSIGSLQRFKDSVREVKEGFECGIALDGYNDIKVGDTIDSFETIAEARQLSEQLVM